MLISKIQEYMTLKNYSRKSIDSYVNCAKKIYQHFKKPINKITNQEFKDFLSHLIRRKLSSQTVNQYHAALKLVFTKIYKIPFISGIPYSKRIKRLPVVLSRNEISKIIESVVNPKHKLLIALSYGAGLRVSEIINLKIQDIDLAELTVHIKQAKGNKDRITVFPKKLLPEIQNLISGKERNDFVFASERGGKLTTRTAQKVFENALQRTGIKKEATFHSLRHSFATHLLENAVDVRYVQKLLGHQNIRTTQRYTQVTNPKLKNIKSPLD